MTGIRNTSAFIKEEKEFDEYEHMEGSIMNQLVDNKRNISTGI